MLKYVRPATITYDTQSILIYIRLNYFTSHLRYFSKLVMEFNFASTLRFQGNLYMGDHQDFITCWHSLWWSTPAICI